MKTENYKKLHYSILNGTIQFFKGKERYQSYFHQISGQCCAIGRYLEDPKEFQETIYKTPTQQDQIYTIIQYPQFYSFETYDIRSLFKPKYRKVNKHFWKLIQELHDDNLNWYNGDLSFMGKNKVESIKVYIDHITKRYDINSNYEG